MKIDFITVEHMKGWLAIEESPFFFFTSRGGQAVFQELCTNPGGTTVREICFLVHRGDGPPPEIWNTGAMPNDDGVRNDGHGWLVGCIRLLPTMSPAEIRSKLKQRISEMEKLLASAPVAALKGA